MMTPLSAAVLKAVNQPEQATSIARTLIIAGATWVIAKYNLPPDLFLPIVLVGVQLWSAIEKAVIRGDFPKSAKSLPLVRRVPQVSNIVEHVQSLVGKVEGFVQSHPLDPAVVKDLDSLVMTFVNEGDALAKKAINSMPPAIAENAEIKAAMGDLIDQLKNNIATEASAKINSLSEAKNSLNQ